MIGRSRQGSCQLENYRRFFLRQKFSQFTISNAMPKRRDALSPLLYRSISESLLKGVLAAICLVGVLASAPLGAQDMPASSAASTVPGVYNPVADPKAVVRAAMHVSPS